MKKIDKRTRDIHKLLVEKIEKEELVHKGYPLDTKTMSDANSRIAVLKKQLKKIESNLAPRKTMFLSFASTANKRYIAYIRKKAKDYSFEVKDAYEDYDGNERIISNVIQGISECFFFLGVMTPRPDFKIVTDNGSDEKFFPSIWVIEEKAIALALKKRFRLLVDNDIHQDAWLTVDAGRLGHRFTESNFERRADRVLSVLDREYKEYIEKIKFS